METELDLITVTEASTILNIKSGLVHLWISNGRIEFSETEETEKGKRVFVSLSEILRIKTERDEFERLTKDLASWTEILELTGLRKNQVQKYIRNKDFPVKRIPRGKRIDIFFDKKEVLGWMKLWQGEIPLEKQLLSTSEAERITGYSYRTLHRYIKEGELKYAHFKRTPAPYRRTTHLSALGQGYWFQLEELIRFRTWLDNKLKAMNSYRGHPERSNSEVIPPSQTSDPKSPPTKRTPRVSKEIQIDLDLTKLESGERAIAILKGLETRIYTLVSNGTHLKAQDIYQLVQSCKAIKGEWRNLKRRYPRKEIDAQLSKEILASLEARINNLSNAGAALGPLEIYYLTMAEAFVQAELKIMAKTEVEGSGLSADDFLLERVAANDSG